MELHLDKGDAGCHLSSMQTKYLCIEIILVFAGFFLGIFLKVSLVFDLEIILIFHPHYHTHSGNTSRPVNLAVVRWLVSYEDENEYGNDNGNEIEE